VSEEEQQLKTPQEIPEELVADEKINEVLSEIPEEFRGKVSTIIEDPFPILYRLPTTLNYIGSAEIY